MLMVSPQVMLDGWPWDLFYQEPQESLHYSLKKYKNDTN